MSLLNQYDRLLIVYRRLFSTDHSRMFVGKVEGYEDGIVRITGFTFARDVVDGNYCRKQQSQTKLLALSSGTLITYLLPADFAVDDAETKIGDLGLYLTDNHGHDLNISEWIHKA